MRYFRGLISAAILCAGASVFVHAPRAEAKQLGHRVGAVHVERRAQTGATMLGIVNADRAAVGLAPLVVDRQLAIAAQLHSVDMSQHHYFSHSSRDGSSPFDRMARVGVRFRVEGENLGVDTGTSRLQMLKAIEAAMLKSPEHRANLLRKAFTRIGIGIVASHGQMYVTEDFGG